MKKNKVDIVTLGCSKNLVDSERLMRQFTASGYRVAHDPLRVNGEVVVVNTCGFTAEAQEESINTLLALGQAKRDGQIGSLYVMGCLSERFRKELQEELPEVDAFYGKFDWPKLLSRLGKAYDTALASERILTTPPHYAYIKVSEGCDRRCAYCAIPLMTGAHRSVPIDAIEQEVRRLTDKGVQEFQLIAQELTSYGRDLLPHTDLPELVRRLSDISGVRWLRLHYAYPSEFPEKLLALMRERDNVCRYIDIALQHISDRVLARMRRGVTADETRSLIDRMRQAVPGLHLRTTIMTGFPGETDEDVEQLARFVSQTRFERLGGFTYSHQQGTYAYNHYADDIPEDVKQQRLDYILSIQETIAGQLNAGKIGTRMTVVIDREEPEFYVGRSEFDSPEVDPEVLVRKLQPLKPGDFCRVSVTDADCFDLYAEPLG
ncbi:MAG: 30S ribosomal protein S12 methylthiotransferase RimO [Tannerellaceae bacterium]|jgi:ribosomal protein S12 methylthiotransferase|nr:30S ribosomal protein S12 methylthiotransferase RimO [Tannerellaceae bacterium]